MERGARGAVPRRPVLVVEADGLADELVRLAAAAGCDADRLDGPAGLRERWGAAPLVLLDPPAAVRAVRAGLPRRDGVVVVADHPDPVAWRAAVAVGAEHVAVLPDAEAWLVGALADAADAPARPGRVLAVLGGRGGAGASVLAAAVGVAALRADRGVLLVDCDALGGGLDLAVGAEDAEGLRWPGLGVRGGRVAAASLHAALPASGVPGAGRLTVLSCDRDGPGPDATAVRTVCQAGRRAGEVVVCDLPRHPGEVAAAALDAADLAVLVVPAEVRACAAAAAIAARVGERGVPLQLVVRGPAPGGLGPADVASALGLPLLAAMRPQPGIGAALDRGQAPGRGRGPLATAARQVLEALLQTGAAPGRAA